MVIGAVVRNPPTCCSSHLDPGTGITEQGLVLRFATENTLHGSTQHTVVNRVTNSSQQLQRQLFRNLAERVDLLFAFKQTGFGVGTFVKCTRLVLFWCVSFALSFAPVRKF